LIQRHSGTLPPGATFLLNDINVHAEEKAMHAAVRGHMKSAA
jgi:hypothetical protein